VNTFESIAATRVWREIAWRASVVCALTLGAWCGAAHAEKGDREKPINYSADFDLNDPFSAIGNDVALIAVPEPGTAAILLASPGLARRRRVH